MPNAAPASTGRTAPLLPGGSLSASRRLRSSAGAPLFVSLSTTSARSLSSGIAQKFSASGTGSFIEEQGRKFAGVRDIVLTQPNGEQPYVAHWWGAGHIIGYEHAFTHAVSDFLTALEKQTTISPNLYDGMKCMQVLEAGTFESQDFSTAL